MKIEINAKHFSLNEEQLNFVKEKAQKLKDLSKTLNDESHIIHINFDHIESKIKDENLICTITIQIKWHKEIRVERKYSWVEWAFMEAKKVAILEIKKLKEQINPNWIHNN